MSNSLIAMDLIFGFPLLLAGGGILVLVIILRTLPSAIGQETLTLDWGTAAVFILVAATLLAGVFVRGTSLEHAWAYAIFIEAPFMLVAAIRKIRTYRRMIPR